jgi:hypothetical protein
MDAGDIFNNGWMLRMNADWIGVCIRIHFCMILSCVSGEKIMREPYIQYRFRRVPLSQMTVAELQHLAAPGGDWCTDEGDLPDCHEIARSIAAHVLRERQ